jgi:acyl carrier protein
MADVSAPLVVMSRLTTLLDRVLERPPDQVPLPRDVNLRELGLDSVKAITMLVEVESTFGIVIPDDLINERTFGTIERLSLTIRSLQGSQLG